MVVIVLVLMTGVAVIVGFAEIEGPPAPEAAVAEGGSDFRKCFNENGLFSSRFGGSNISENTQIYEFYVSIHRTQIEKKLFFLF